MPDHAVLDLAGLQALVDVLRERGYTVLGPTVRDGAIVPAPVTSVDDLPRGWGDEQDGALYRLTQRDDDALFGFASGAQSFKPVLFPAEQLMWRARRTDDGFETEPAEPGSARFGAPPYALLGVRSCDLHAIGIHDTVLLGRTSADAHYAEAREAAFVVAVSCSDPAGTCFCVSMGTGPRPDAGFDLSLTELSTAVDDHRMLVEIGSERGHPQWEDVASRCLACGNCTMVCPTCFCTSVEDHTALTGQEASRSRVWDSCFTGDFSYLHGGSVRSSVGSRYRQWATHKLAAWVDQFGSSGCVGCGRCITWCPAAIDITAEVAALRTDPRGD